MINASTLNETTPHQRQMCAIGFITNLNLTVGSASIRYCTIVNTNGGWNLTAGLK